MTFVDRLRRLLYPLVDEPESDDDDPAREHEPEPERHEYEETITTTVYRTTLTYRNGDTETFYSYGVYQRSEDFIEFKDALSSQWGWNMQTAHHTYSKRKVHVRLLSRDPALAPIATEWWQLSYETEDRIDPHQRHDEKLDTESIDLSLMHAARLPGGDT